MDGPAPPAPPSTALTAFARDAPAPDRRRTLAEHHRRRRRVTRWYGLGVGPAIACAVWLLARFGGLHPKDWADLLLWVMVPAPVLAGVALEVHLRRSLSRALGQAVPGQLIDAGLQAVAELRNRYPGPLSERAAAEERLFAATVLSHLPAAGPGAVTDDDDRDGPAGG